MAGASSASPLRARRTAATRCSGAPAGAALHRYVTPLMGDEVGLTLPPSYIALYHAPQLVLLALGGLVIAVAGALLPAGWAARGTRPVHCVPNERARARRRIRTWSGPTPGAYPVRGAVGDGRGKHRPNRSKGAAK